MAFIHHVDTLVGGGATVSGTATVAPTYPSTAAKSNYLETALLNHVLGGLPFTPPASLYLGLFTAAPSDASPGTEVAASDYGRIAIAFAPSIDNSIRNGADLAFPMAASSWGTLTHFGIFDAASGGNLLYFGEFDASIAVDALDIVQFLIGDLVITED